MTLTYIHHSAFRLESRGVLVVLDFYADAPGATATLRQYIEGLDRPVVFLASHSHGDHFNPELLAWHTRQPASYVLASEIRRQHRELRDRSDITWLHRGQAADIGPLHIDALGSTDVGCSFLLTLDNRRVFHAGDFNNWLHPDAGPEERHRMEAYFRSELKAMTSIVQHCDLALFPVDHHLGHDVLAGPLEFCQVVRPKRFVPMHQWEEYSAQAPLAEALPPLGVEFVANRGSLELEL